MDYDDVLRLVIPVLFAFIFMGVLYAVLSSSIEEQTSRKNIAAICLDNQMIAVETRGGVYCVNPSDLNAIK